MSDDLTPREQIARRLLGIAALEKLLAAEKRALRAEAAAVYTKAGQRDPIELPDGTPLGNVRVDKVSGGWQVTDAGKLRAWVETNLKCELVEQKTVVVDPDFITECLAQLAERGTCETVDPETGEVADFIPAGIEYVPAGTRLMVTTDKGAPEAVRRLLGDTAAQLGLRELEG